PVPGGATQRQRAKRVPEMVEPPLVKLFMWAPSKGSSPGDVAHQASCRNLAPPVVSAQLASASTCQPHWATEYLPAVASRAASSKSANANAIPIATIRPSPPRVPDISSPLVACAWRAKGTAPASLPLADECPVGDPATCRAGGSAKMAPMPLPTEEQITEKLRVVIDPELRRSIVELGMVRSIEVKESGRVEVVVSLTTAGCPIRAHFEQAVAQQVSELDGVTGVAVGFDVLSDEEKGSLQKTLGRGKLPEGALAQVKNV